MRSLLLDTQVVIWLLLGARDRVPSELAARLEAPQTSVRISAVSTWEIAIKRSLGKLEIEEHWLSAIDVIGFEPLPITAPHTAQVERLPWHHRDPFDRLLVAQAMVESCAVVSTDARLRAYDVEVIWP